MSDLGRRYRVDEPRILAEEVSGEILAIDNRTGAYASITGSGVAIWNLVTAGYTPAETSEALAAHVEAELDEIRATVLAFVDRLVAAELIVAAERPAPDATARLVGDGPEPFDEPKLDVYTDMEALLLFDPIHEVEEQGWSEIEPGVDTG
jgi:hypothetical protein